MKKPWFILLIKFLIITVVFGTIYTISQQVLRMDVNDPQIQIAEDVAANLGTGTDPQTYNYKQKTDIGKSLATFLVIYDNSGKAIASSATLNNQFPSIPSGVFDFVRKYGEDKVTWQPTSDLRVALVVTQYKDGFVAVGRSIREVESREDKILLLVGFGYLLTLIFFGLKIFLHQKLEKPKRNGKSCC